MGGSVTPFIYYGFMCEPMHTYRILYLAFTWSFSIMAFMIALYPSKYRETCLAVSFIIAGWSCLPPIMHLVYYADERYVY